MSECIKKTSDSVLGRKLILRSNLRKFLKLMSWSSNYQADACNIIMQNDVCNMISKIERTDSDVELRFNCI